MGLLDNRTGTYQSPMGLLPVQQRRNNTGFPSAYPVPESTPFADFGRGILDAFTYTLDPDTTYMERSFGPLAADMEAIISGFDAQGNKVPDSLQMMSLMMPGGTGLGGKAGLGFLGAATGAVPKVGSAYASRLIPTLENMPQEKMSAEQFSGWLSKQPVGADELEYSGIPGLLAQGGDVTKTGLLNQARANPLDIQDVKLVEGAQTPDYNKRRYEMMVAGEGDYANMPPSLREERAEQMLSRIRANEAENIVGRTKFEDKQLPGGENYREMLLTLPVKNPIKINAEIVVSANQADDILGEMSARGMENLDYGRVTREDGNEVIELTGFSPSDMKAVRDIARKYNAIPSRPKSEGTELTFRGSHFNEPNVLAHARYNTRTIDGDKTLFIEEIQSDWHQMGRDVGYRQDGSDVAAKIRAKEQEILSINAERDAAMPDYDVTKINTIDDLPGHTAQESLLYDKYLAAQDELSVLKDEAMRLGSGVPEAPYKRTDKWAGLTLQRMIKEAVDSGHDRIAWTPGKVQAERYDLSKQVDTIRVEKLRDGDKAGQYYVTGEKNGSAVGLEEVVTEDKLPDLIGKDLADKATKDAATGKYPDGRDYSGVDLQVGGEGMEEFYDKMLVKSANKFGKKYGAKAQKSTLKTTQDGDVGQSALDLRYYHYDKNGMMDTSRSWKTEAEAEAALAETVWSMKITPEMKAGISKGVMLGQTGAEGKIAAGLLSQNDDEQMPKGFPVRGLLGGTLYTATTPDGFI